MSSKVQPSRFQSEEIRSSQQPSHFTLPQWMTSISLMGQDQSSQVSHSDYQEDSVMPSSKLSNVRKHCDEGQLDTSSVGYVSFAADLLNFKFCCSVFRVLNLCCNILWPILNLKDQNYIKLIYFVFTLYIYWITRESFI